MFPTKEEEVNIQIQFIINNFTKKEVITIINKLIKYYKITIKFK